MMLAAVEYNDGKLCIRRLNTSFIASIKSGIATWLILIGFLIVVVQAEHILSPVIIKPEFRPTVPITFFPDVLFLAVGMALGMLIELGPDFIGLLSAENFTFDKQNDAFLVNGKVIGKLSLVKIQLQDRFSSSRRALRIIVSLDGSRKFIVAQTQRIVIQTLIPGGYHGAILADGLNKKYNYMRWADYDGVSTGFDPNWPEYREIFALYDSLKEYLSTGKDSKSTSPL